MFLEAAIRDLFVAGDVRHGFTKRVAPEVGVGSIDIQLMHQCVLGA
jgi:thioredoxin reductase (NADPH)